MGKSFKRQPREDFSEHRVKVHLQHEMKKGERLLEEFEGDERVSKYMEDPVFVRCLKEK